MSANSLFEFLQDARIMRRVLRASAYLIVALIVWGCSETQLELPVAGDYIGTDPTENERFNVNVVWDGDQLDGLGLDRVGDWQVYSPKFVDWISVRRIVSFSGTLTGDQVTAEMRDEDGIEYLMEGQFGVDTSATIRMSGGQYDSTVFRATFMAH